MKTVNFKQTTKIALWALLLILPLALVGFRPEVSDSDPEIRAGLNGQQVKVEIHCNPSAIPFVCDVPKYVIKQLLIAGDNQNGDHTIWTYTCPEADPGNCPLTVQTDGYWWQSSKNLVIISGELWEIQRVQIGSQHNSKNINLGAFDVPGLQILPTNTVVFKYDPFLNTWDK